MTDTSAFDEFVAARSTRLLRMAFMLTRDWGAAEDLLQESLAKTWFAWSRIDGSPEPYVRRIIVTSYISLMRRRWRHETPIDDVAPLQAAATDAIGPADDRDALWRALGRLPARQRAVVVLRYYEDLSETDVANLMNSSIGTVKSQTAKALAKLRADVSFDLDPAPVATHLVRALPRPEGAK